MVRAVLDCCPSGLMTIGHGLMLTLWPPYVALLSGAQGESGQC